MNLFLEFIIGTTFLQLLLLIFSTYQDVLFYFQSAWSPPVEAYRKLEDLGFGINAFYYEPGVQFAGQYYDGTDDCYDLSSMNSEQVKEELPVEVNEEFGISEQMAEWEEENEEEAGLG